MEMLPRLVCLLAIFISSCAYLGPVNQGISWRQGLDQAQVESIKFSKLHEVQVPLQKTVVAIYPTSFTDQTGQRKSNSSFALFSTAITQAPHTLLIRALKNAANGEFFIVAERVGLDNLTKERQLIRSTREQFEDKDGKRPLPPLLFAGVLLEGGVIAYDTNIRTGGGGARYLGLGANHQYREDKVTVSLRMVSVTTGEVLIEVLTSKTIFSYAESQDAFRFIEAGTELVEIEVGYTTNESGTIALEKAVEAAVLEIINIGYDRSYWKHE
jgi:curli production assembly/transport component CsgG